jgi:hypothetical protein
MIIVISYNQFLLFGGYCVHGISCLAMDISHSDLSVAVGYLILFNYLSGFALAYMCISYLFRRSDDTCYSQVLKLLADEQGDWYVERIISHEVGKILLHNTENIGSLDSRWVRTEYESDITVCSSGASDSDISGSGASDSGVSDSGVVSSGVVGSGVVGSGVAGSGASDSGASDSGVVGTDVADSGASDSGVVGTGVVGTDVVDTDVADSGVSDTGASDSGVVEVSDSVVCSEVYYQNILKYCGVGMYI